MTLIESVISPRRSMAQASSHSTRRTWSRSVPSGSLGPGLELGRAEDIGQLVAHRVGEVRGAQELEVSRDQAGLLAELAPGRLLGRLVAMAPALGDLPRVAVERVAILPDEPDAPPIVDGEDADRPVLEMDHAVDPRLAVGPEDLVFPQSDPGILVDRPTAQGRPGVRMPVGDMGSRSRSGE